MAPRTSASPAPLALRLAFLAALVPCGLVACAAPSDDVEQAEDDLVPDEADAEPVGSTGEAIRRTEFDTPRLSATEREAVLAKYGHVDRSRVIDRQLREDALVYFDVNKSQFDNTGYLAVVDFKKASKDKRFYLVDVRSGAVTAYVTAHGSGSDPNDDGRADKFSNVKNSNASSVGYYVTGEIYDGKWGRSLRLDGLSDTNSNVRGRDVVVHGANYVRDGRAKQGRSWGCFALPMSQKDGVISKLAGGALIYADR